MTIMNIGRTISLIATFATKVLRFRWLWLWPWSIPIVQVMYYKPEL